MKRRFYLDPGLLLLIPVSLGLALIWLWIQITPQRFHWAFSKATIALFTKLGAYRKADERAVQTVQYMFSHRKQSYIDSILAEFGQIRSMVLYVLIHMLFYRTSRLLESVQVTVEPGCEKDFEEFVKAFEGQGAVIMGAHFYTWEMVLLSIAKLTGKKHFPHFAANGKKPPTDRLSRALAVKLFLQRRARFGNRSLASNVPKENRVYLRDYLLKPGKSSLFTLDWVNPGGDNEKNPFVSFGRNRLKRSFRFAPTLVKQSNKPAFVISPLCDSAYPFKLRLFVKKLSPYPTSNEFKDMEKLERTYASLMEAYPGQYLWFYPMFKGASQASAHPQTNSQTAPRRSVS